MRDRSILGEMLARERRRPFVRRGDRLEAIVRGTQEGRARAHPGSNPADLYTARIAARFEWPPPVADPAAHRSALIQYGIIDAHRRRNATFRITDLSEC